MAPAHDLDSHMEQGRAAQRQGNVAAAAEIFTAASRLFPSSPEPAFARCMVALERSDPRAGMLVQDLLSRFPAHAAGWADLGMWLLKAGKAEAALACLRRAATVAPEARLFIASGDALRHLGRVPEARAAYADACRRAPDSARAAFMLGLCAQDARDLPEARAGY